MEKVWNSDELLPKKIKSIMKITLLFLILGILHVSADTYAQKAQVTVEVKNGTFYDVVSEIEKQTEFMFFYKSEDIDNSKQVDIQVKNRQVTDVLNELLKNTNLTYRISGKHITILKKDAVQQQKKKISGIVTDPDGIPVIGANVVIRVRRSVRLRIWMESLAWMRLITISCHFPISAMRSKRSRSGIVHCLT